jgi:tRNA A37 threonylcarbamoyltransferase TsaD
MQEARSVDQIDGIAYRRAGAGERARVRLWAVRSPCRNVPCVGIHHMEGLLSPMLEPDPPAFTALLVSGGHAARRRAGAGPLHHPGESVDDAGQAFDKPPNRPASVIRADPRAQAALGGDPKRFQFHGPRPAGSRPGAHPARFQFQRFSTAVVTAVQTSR